MRLFQKVGYSRMGLVRLRRLSYGNEFKSTFLWKKVHFPSSILPETLLNRYNTGVTFHSGPPTSEARKKGSREGWIVAHLLASHYSSLRERIPRTHRVPLTTDTTPDRIWKLFQFRARRTVTGERIKDMTADGVTRYRETRTSEKENKG